MWEDILKGSWGNKNFKILKEFMLEHFSKLDKGTYLVEDLSEEYRELVFKGIGNQRGKFSSWWKTKGIQWYIQKAGRIGTNANLIEAEIQGSNRYFRKT